MKPTTEMLEAKDATMLVFSKKKVFSQIFRKISVVLQKEKKSLRAKNRKFSDEEKQVMTLARF